MPRVAMVAARGPLEKAVRHAIESALRRPRGRVGGKGGAARVLGVNPNTPRSKIRKLSIDPTAFRC